MKSKVGANKVVYLFDGKKGRKMPSKDRRLEIESLVNKIIKENDIETPGFDLTQFLNKNGFIVVLQDMEDNDTTGLLFIDDVNCIPNSNTHKLIAINSKIQSEPDFFQRRRYIAAHEFAHSKLHKKDLNQYAHRDYSKKNDPAEKEADFFARCLLMPKNLVNQFLNVSFMKDISLDAKVAIIAKLFNVTARKAKIRLVEDLGYNG